MTEQPCEYCGSGYVPNRCPECNDWECGTQRLCGVADLALPAGIYRSKACRVVESSGGWKATDE